VFVSSPRATAVNQELLVLINIDAPLNTVTHSALFLLCGLQIPKSKYFILIDYFNAKLILHYFFHVKLITKPQLAKKF